MDAMYSAIKKRRGLIGDHQSMGHSSQHVADDTNKGEKKMDEGKNLHAFVAALNDHEKGQLKDILGGNDKTMEIMKGAPSSEERSKISAASSAENARNEAEESSGGHGNAVDPIDSDEIAKSMLDSRHMGSNAPTGKPRNLGERMKMGIAAKLKAKGKI